MTPICPSNTRPLRFVSHIGLILLALAAITCPRIVSAQDTSTAAATDCTLYASPSGNDSNSGTSPSSPITFRGAAKKTVAGSVVCLLSGTYYVDTPFQITRSGNSSKWVVYKSYNGGVVIAPRSGSYDLIQVTAGVQYIEITGLQFNAQNTAAAGIGCQGCNHVSIIGNTINDAGSAAIAVFPDAASGKHSDYITVDHNQIYHTGYRQGWGSGISFKQNVWYDQYQGFHSFVTNNMVSGTYDGSTHHSDGNGIIMDNQSGANTPPALIANNVVYQNGGRCIHSRYAMHIWIVNNTCYKNGLDLSVAGGQPLAEYPLYGSSGDYVINNVTYAWGNRYSYYDINGTMATYYRNLWYTSGTGTNLVPSSVSGNSSMLKKGNSQFVNPPYVAPGTDGQYNNAVPPDQITNQFQLLSGSPAIGSGIDPTTIPNVSSAILTGLRTYIYKDINGNARGQGSGFDLGAYQSSSSSGGTQSTTLNAVADAYVDSGYPGTNYGGTSPLKVASTPSTRISYFRFDLLSLAGTSVSSATLRVYVYNGATGTANLKSVSDTSWTENGITYSNRPGLGSVIGSASNPAGGSWISIDVTSQVKARLGQLISFGIDMSNAKGLMLDSREVAHNKPQLVIQ
jgi:hypothetical protein